MSQGLGYRPRNDHIAERQGDRQTRMRTMQTQEPEPVQIDSVATLHTSGYRMSVVKGFIPLLLMSVTFVSVPIIFYYGDLDFTETNVRAGVITAAALLGFIVTIANDCCSWFNIMLFFHIGMEVKVVDNLLDFADTAGGKDETLAMAAACVIIVHLIPFLLIDNTAFLSILAFIGIVTNTAAIVMTHSSTGEHHSDIALLLSVGSTSISLLFSTLFIRGICGVKCRGRIAIHRNRGSDTN